MTRSRRCPTRWPRPTISHETVKLVEDTGARIVAREADVRDREALSTALQAGLDEFGRLDIVIANAGIAPMQSGEEGWRDVVDVNLTGVHHTVDVAIPTMVEQGDGGAIVLTSSAAGLVGIGGDDPGSLGYTAAKHGVVGLMRAYANHLAPHSIRVNSIHPAAVNTPMINNEFTRQWLERITQRVRRTGRLRHGTAGAGRRPPRTSRTRWRGWCPTRPGTSPGVTLPVDAGYANKR